MGKSVEIFARCSHLVKVPDEGIFAVQVDARGDLARDSGQLC